MLSIFYRTCMFSNVFRVLWQSTIVSRNIKFWVFLANVVISVDSNFYNSSLDPQLELLALVGEFRLIEVDIIGVLSIQGVQLPVFFCISCLSVFFLYLGHFFIIFCISPNFTLIFFSVKF